MKNRSDQTADAEAGAAGVDAGDTDAVGLINGVDYHAAADIDGNVAGIADQITGLSLGIADAAAGVTLRTGVVLQRNAEVAIHPHRKAGAVAAVGQAGAAPDVGVADELLGIGDDLSAGDGRTAAGAGTGTADKCVQSFFPA